MANGPPCMNKNMAPNPTGANLCLCYPSVHPRLDIVQVELQYVTKINPEPHDHTVSSVAPHYSWVQQDIKVTLKLHDTPIPKQGFLIYDDDKRSFRPGRKKNRKQKYPPSPSMTSSKSLPISYSPNNYSKGGSPSTIFMSYKNSTPPLPNLSVKSSLANLTTQPTSRNFPSDIFFRQTH